MNNQPQVSVIIPSYNHENFIRQAIESVARQTYKNIELYVIDDGSVDKSQEIIKELQKIYNFNFQSQKNTGLIPTLNKIIPVCKGKYIAICASDDMWTLDKIDKQVLFMEKNNDIGACGGNVLMINEKDEILPNFLQKFSSAKFYSFQDVILLKAYLPALTVMFRKDIFENSNFYDENYKIEDLYMWLKITYSGYKIAILNDLMGFYRIHYSNSHFDVLKMYEGTMKIFDIYKKHSLYKKAVKLRRLHYFPYLAVYNRKEARKIFTRVISFKLSFIAGCFLLLIPSAISKTIIKFVTKYVFKEYNYLTK